MKGWKLVPVEPTREMADEAWKYGNEKTSEAPDPVYAYKAMLAVAPTPPAQEEDAEPRLVSYAPDFSTCTLSFGGVEMYFDRIPPAQEAEPVYQVLRKAGWDWDTVSKEQYDICTGWPSGHLADNRILYTHPQSDKLRQAVEELVRYMDNPERIHCVAEYMPLVEKLRSVLEGE